MALAKRVFLFMAVNVLVMITISIITSALGLNSYLSANGIDYTSLMVFCLIWGMGGSFISLALSRVMAKMMTGTRVIAINTSHPDEQWLLNKVHQLSRAAGLKVMPEVGVYDSPEMNAFATGPTKSRALVSVSTGLLRRMNKDQVEGVLAHEVAHVANGDMVTMTLVQGIVNAFVMFFARIIAFAVSQAVREDLAPIVRMVTTIVLDIAFAFLGYLVVAFFSRQREFRADKGAAMLVGPTKMSSALMALKSQVMNDDGIQDETPSIASLKISGKPGRFVSLFSTHPPLDERIARLRQFSA